ncbi:hypothetical protein [Silanimonas sp.]|uniref:hypothetical protein n=1 Tax=Silanimonas sp. TaxID=1929290 RepID=UPI0037C96A1B
MVRLTVVLLCAFALGATAPRPAWCNVAGSDVSLPVNPSGTGVDVDVQPSTLKMLIPAQPGRGDRRQDGFDAERSGLLGRLSGGASASGVVGGAIGFAIVDAMNAASWRPNYRAEQSAIARLERNDSVRRYPALLAEQVSTCLAPPDGVHGGSVVAKVRWGLSEDLGRWIVGIELSLLGGLGQAKPETAYLGYESAAVRLRDKQPSDTAWMLARLRERGEESSRAVRNAQYRVWHPEQAPDLMIDHWLRDGSRHLDDVLAEVCALAKTWRSGASFPLANEALVTRALEAEANGEAIPGALDYGASITVVTPGWRLRTSHEPRILASTMDGMTPTVLVGMTMRGSKR